MTQRTVLEIEQEVRNTQEMSRALESALAEIETLKHFAKIYDYCDGRKIEDFENYLTDELLRVETTLDILTHDLRRKAPHDFD